MTYLYSSSAGSFSLITHFWGEFFLHYLFAGGLCWEKTKVIFWIGHQKSSCFTKKFVIIHCVSVSQFFWPCPWSSRMEVVGSGRQYTDQILIIKLWILLILPFGYATYLKTLFLPSFSEIAAFKVLSASFCMLVWPQDIWMLFHILWDWLI